VDDNLIDVCWSDQPESPSGKALEETGLCPWELGLYVSVKPHPDVS
jgi:hypothetical protein